MQVLLTTYKGIFLGPIAKVLGYILQGIYMVLSQFGIENTAICIVIFTFFINALMIPLQFKQQKFAKISAIMNPEIQEIQKKYKNKKDSASQQKMSMETQAIYHKYGVSPASGCLPILITIPIFFALYRVIYNIPAYVPQVYKIYNNLASKLLNAGISIGDLSSKKYVKTSTYVVTQAVKNAQKDPKNIHYYIDILSQYGTDGWHKLASNYDKYSQLIHTTADKATHINSFFGLNIADRPMLASITIIIPILSIITQAMSTKISMAGNPQALDSSNPAAQSMKTMNFVMPFISGAMCFMFPIGVSIYWIAGNVFRIIQSSFINLYFSKIDMDAQVEKNLEKAKSKYERLGLDTSNLEKAANKTTSLGEKKNMNIKEIAGKKVTDEAKIPSNKKANIKEIAGKKVTGEVKIQPNKKYKQNSIAAYANILKTGDTGATNSKNAKAASDKKDTDENKSEEATIDQKNKK
jgi:YidC/Oxa1 family membrane protein insertase